MAACDMCGGQGSCPQRAPRGIVYAACPACGGTGQMANPHAIVYPPSVLAALRQAGAAATAAQQQAVRTFNQAVGPG